MTDLQETRLSSPVDQSLLGFWFFIARPRLEPKKQKEVHHEHGSLRKVLREASPQIETDGTALGGEPCAQTPYRRGASSKVNQNCAKVDSVR